MREENDFSTRGTAAIIALIGIRPEEKWTCKFVS